ncbi:beta family protein [Xenorhabdus bovienii]|uniref:beta family protein n=1 Tax=Xenorhabdus bovienii TaxID=40576 RepID=UPI003DA48290
MFETISYIPILKAKRAELTALSQMDTFTKSKIIPLLEIEPVPIDLESDEPSRQYDDTLSEFGLKVVAGCSGIAAIFLDGILIEDQFIAPTDQYPIENATIQIREAGLKVIPVTSPTRSVRYKQSISTLVQDEVCLRLTTTDLVNPQLVTNYIRELNIAPRYIDVIIDLRDMLSGMDINSAYVLASGVINSFVDIHQFRSITLASGSFPVDLRDISVGTYPQARLEWILWQDIHSNNQLPRNIIYSDYGVQHPDYTRLTTKYPNTSASVRYTGDNDFWVFRGRLAKQYGYEQYGAHSQEIISHPEYSGSSFSTGDKAISDYAQTYERFVGDPDGKHKFGSAEIWRRIGQNHHITKVVSQLSNLYGL